MNETLAGIIARETGSKIYRQHYEAAEKRQPRKGNDDFNFNAEMRKTRIEVDRLLALGHILEAERYMEGRRQVFVENGYAIRKINQAYFAFHGIYGQDPGAVSPIYQDMQKMRSGYVTLAEFVRDVSAMTRYEQLHIAAQ
jgi:hypothetical protein